jgi:hypothetical protein
MKGFLKAVALIFIVFILLALLISSIEITGTIEAVPSNSSSSGR